MMKIEISKQSLHNALNCIKKNIPVRPVKEILGCFKLIVKNSKIFLTSFDLVTEIKIEIDGTIVDNGDKGSVADLDIYIPFKNLSTLLRKGKKGNITISYIHEGLQVEYSGKTTTLNLPKNPLNVLDCASLINNPEFSEEVLSSILLDALKKSVNFASQEEAKRAFYGVNFKCKDGNTVIAATDGHRLSVVKCLDMFKSDVCFTISHKELLKLVDILKTEKGSIKIQIEDKNCEFIGKKFQFKTRLIEYEYPEYELLFPSYQVKKSATVHKDEFIEGVIDIKDLSCGITMIFENDKSTIELKTQNLNPVSVKKHYFYGDYTRKINGKVDVEDLTSITLNSQYLLDALKVCGENEVKLEFSKDPSQGFLITAGNFTHLIACCKPNQETN